MALPNAVRVSIPVVAIGLLFAANRVMDRVESRQGGAAESAGLPPQPVAFGRFSFEAPMTLVSKPVSDAVRGQWVPPFTSVNQFDAFENGFAVNAMWATGAADSAAIDPQRVATNMAQALAAQGGFTQTGAEAVRAGARTGYRVRGTLARGAGGSGDVDIVVLGAGDELLSVVLLGPPARVRGGADHVVKTLAAR